MLSGARQRGELQLHGMLTACTARHSSQADRARPRFRPRRVALSVAVGLPMSANAVETVLDFRRLDAIVQM